jgi:GTPase SAR1 family protein
MDPVKPPRGTDGTEDEDLDFVRGVCGQLKPGKGVEIDVSDGAWDLSANGIKTLAAGFAANADSSVKCRALCCTMIGDDALAELVGLIGAGRIRGVVSLDLQGGGEYLHDTCYQESPCCGRLNLSDKLLEALEASARDAPKGWTELRELMLGCNDFSSGNLQRFLVKVVGDTAILFPKLVRIGSWSSNVWPWKDGDDAHTSTTIRELNLGMAAPWSGAHGGLSKILSSSRCSALRVLDLAGAELFPDGEFVVVQFAALFSCRKEGFRELKVLNLGYRVDFGIGRSVANDLDAAAIKELVGCAGHLASLTRLSLDGNPIGDDGAKALAEALRGGKFPKLEGLDVSNSGIGSTGGNALLTCVSSRSSSPLVELNLRSNMITMLQPDVIHASLTQLSLDENPIGDAGAQALAEALRGGKFPALMDLDVSRCGIRNAGGNALLSCVLVGGMKLVEPKLVKLNLGDNKIISLSGALTSFARATQIVKLTKEWRSWLPRIDISFSRFEEDTDVTRVLRTPPAYKVDTPGKFRTLIESIATQGLDTESRRRRLVFVGPGGAGKTTLVNILTDPETSWSRESAGRRINYYVHSEEGKAVTTHGINTASWRPARAEIQGDVIPEKDRVSFSVYDYAGQMNYYTLHEKVLPKSQADFLVVFRADNLRWWETLVNWLKWLTARIPTLSDGDESTLRLFVVGTHCDQLTTPEARGELKNFDVRAREICAEILGLEVMPTVFWLDYSPEQTPQTHSLGGIYNAIVNGAIEAQDADLVPFFAGRLLRWIPRLARDLAGGGTLAVADRSSIRDYVKDCLRKEPPVRGAGSDRDRRRIDYLNVDENHKALEWELDFLHATGDIFAFEGAEIVVLTPQKFLDIAVGLVSIDDDRRKELNHKYGTSYAAPHALPIKSTNGILERTALVRHLMGNPHWCTESLAGQIVGLLESVHAVRDIDGERLFVPMSLRLVDEKVVFSADIVSGPGVPAAALAVRRKDGKTVLPLGAFARIQHSVLRNAGSVWDVVLAGANVLRLQLRCGDSGGGSQPVVAMMQFSLDSGGQALAIIVRSAVASGSAGGGGKIDWNGTMVGVIVAAVLDVVPKISKDDPPQILWRTLSRDLLDAGLDILDVDLVKDGAGAFSTAAAKLGQGTPPTTPPTWTVVCDVSAENANANLRACTASVPREKPLSTGSSTGSSTGDPSATLADRAALVSAMYKDHKDRSASARTRAVTAWQVHLRGVAVALINETVERLGTGNSTGIASFAPADITARIGCNKVQSEESSDGSTAAGPRLPASSVKVTFSSPASKGSGSSGVVNTDSSASTVGGNSSFPKAANTVSSSIADDMVHVKRLIAYMCLGDSDGKAWARCHAREMEDLAGDLRNVAHAEAADFVMQPFASVEELLRDPLLRERSLPGSDSAPETRHIETENEWALYKKLLPQESQLVTLQPRPIGAMAKRVLVLVTNFHDDEEMMHRATELGTRFARLELQDSTIAASDLTTAFDFDDLFNHMNGVGSLGRELVLVVVSHGAVPLAGAGAGQQLTDQLILVHTEGGQRVAARPLAPVLRSLVDSGRFQSITVLLCTCESDAGVLQQLHRGARGGEANANGQVRVVRLRHCSVEATRSFGPEEMPGWLATEDRALFAAEQTASPSGYKIPVIKRVSVGMALRGLDILKSRYNRGEYAALRSQPIGGIMCVSRDGPVQGGSNLSADLDALWRVAVMLRLIDPESTLGIGHSKRAATNRETKDRKKNGSSEARTHSQSRASTQSPPGPAARASSNDHITHTDSSSSDSSSSSSSSDSSDSSSS